MANTAPPERRSKSKLQPQNNTAAHIFEKETDLAGPTVHEKPSSLAGTPLQEPQFKAPDQTVRLTHKAEEPSIFGGQLSDESPMQTVEPQRTILAPIERETPIGAGPAAKTDNPTAALENGQTSQVEPRRVNAQHAEGRSSFQVEPVTRSIEASRRVENTIRPHQNSELSAPVLKPVPASQPVSTVSRPAAAQPQPGQERESVVQIHIGRIEVRAVTPPPAPRAAQPAAPQPKLSLDDYLRQREEKR